MGYAEHLLILLPLASLVQLPPNALRLPPTPGFGHPDGAKGGGPARKRFCTGSILIGRPPLPEFIIHSPSGRARWKSDSCNGMSELKVNTSPHPHNWESELDQVKVIHFPSKWKAGAQGISSSGDTPFSCYLQILGKKQETPPPWISCQLFGRNRAEHYISSMSNTDVFNKCCRGSEYLSGVLKEERDCVEEKCQNSQMLSPLISKWKSHCHLLFLTACSLVSHTVGEGEQTRLLES